MTFLRNGVLPPEYQPCDYGYSRFKFRGPQCDVARPHVAYLGGAETFGRFLRQPYPDLVRQGTGLGALNLGVVNAGVDLYLKNPRFLHLTQQAQAIVIELPGAAQLSNPYYDVHPLRNDRVLRPHPQLRRMFPDIDWINIHFIRHFLGQLYAQSPADFDHIVKGVQQTWITRMQELITQFHQPVHLLWCNNDAGGDAATTPLFVTAQMVDKLRHLATSVTEITAHPVPVSREQRLIEGMNAPPSALSLGQATHMDIANQLGPLIMNNRGAENAPNQKTA